MTRGVLVVGAIALLSATGCYRFAVVNEKAPEGAKVKNEWQPFAIYGLVPLGENPIEASDKCPDGLAKVEMEHSFLNGLVSWFTFSLFNPITVSYTCAGGSAVQSTAPGAPGAL